MAWRHCAQSGEETHILSPEALYSDGLNEIPLRDLIRHDSVALLGIQAASLPGEGHDSPLHLLHIGAEDDLPLTVSPHCSHLHVLMWYSVTESLMSGRSATCLISVLSGDGLKLFPWQQRQFVGLTSMISVTSLLLNRFLNAPLLPGCLPCLLSLLFLGRFFRCGS